MKRIWPALAVAVVLLLTGCGIQPSAVTARGRAPTGVAPGVTLYFVDGHQRLRPERRPTHRLGTISEAESLLLAGPGGSDLHTEIASSDVTRVIVTSTPKVIMLRVPLAANEVTPLGIDQIVCTAIGVQIQQGGPRDTKVRVQLTLPTPGSDRPRTCPLIR